MPDKMEKVVSLCARRGMIYPAAEIYGSFAGFFDFAGYGAQLKRNVEASWWKSFVTSREDVVGMDGSIITSPQVWKASGHLEEFNDPLVDCLKCKSKFRLDHLIEEQLNLQVDGLKTAELAALLNAHKLKCAKCKGDLAVAEPFNLMFKTSVGAVADERNTAYLRPETAQVIFSDFKQIQLSSRSKLPFGIAQAGKAFRNEISPRNFVFRCREFSQMELEFFIHPDKLDDCTIPARLLEIEPLVLTATAQEKGEPAQKHSIADLLGRKAVKARWHAYWLAYSLDWLHSIGISPENLRIRQHVKTELSHYSSETWDVEYDYPWGWKELMGVANRTDFDLAHHSKESGKDLSYFDEESKKKVVPFVIEPSFGLERIVLTLLLDAYVEKAGKGETKIALALSPSIAPVAVCVFPLMKKDGLAEKAREIFLSLNPALFAEYDDGGSIGRRYARADEAGVPYAITVDYDTLGDGTVTLRDRDSTAQKRIKCADARQIILSLLERTVDFTGIIDLKPKAQTPGE
ncbi:MAG: glycine--tRNA ligase [Candidatus Micrarchaeota archaeon]